MANPALKQKLDKGELVFTTGMWDIASAMLIEKAGFDGVHLGSMTVAGSNGLPDLGLMTPSQYVDLLFRTADRVSIPIVVDFESGWGDAMNAVHWARLMERAGASAIHIDDYGEIDKCPWLPPFLPNLEPAELTASKVRAIWCAPGQAWPIL